MFIESQYFCEIPSRFWNNLVFTLRVKKILKVSCSVWSTLNGEIFEYSLSCWKIIHCQYGACVRVDEYHFINTYPIHNCCTRSTGFWNLFQVIRKKIQWWDSLCSILVFFISFLSKNVSWSSFESLQITKLIKFSNINNWLWMLHNWLWTS